MKYNHTIKVLLFILLFSVFNLICVANASIFEVQIVPKSIDIAITETAIKGQNPLCLQGFVQYCVKEETQKKVTVENRYVMEPFNDELKSSYSGRSLDSEDLYTMGTYDLSRVRLCSRNRTDIMDVYSCVKSFVHEKNLNCRAAASTFKIALLESAYYKNIQKNNSNKTIEIYKAFFYDGGIVSHRFILLKNDNGYYVLDPQQCNSKSNDYCVFLHTKYFYDVPDAINYRGHVYRIAQIV